MRNKNCVMDSLNNRHSELVEYERYLKEKDKEYKGNENHYVKNCNLIC